MANDLLVWCDLETTGLDPETKSILEMAIVITAGPQFETVASCFWILPLSEEALVFECDEWCTKTHKASGLWDECEIRARNLSTNRARVQGEAIAFLEGHHATGLPLCGATIGFDRSFLVRHMPCLAKCFHYRSLDVSTFRVLLPVLGITPPPKKNAHRAMADILESIELARWVAGRMS